MGAPKQHIERHKAKQWYKTWEPLGNSKQLWITEPSDMLDYIEPARAEIRGKKGVPLGSVYADTVEELDIKDLLARAVN